MKNLRRDYTVYTQLKQAAQSRVDAIKVAPQLSDTLFLELLVALRSLGWLQPPQEKIHISALQDGLRESVAALELIRHSAIDVLHSDSDSALRLLTILNEEASKAADLDRRAKAAKSAHSKAQQAILDMAARNIAIEALLPYARIDFSTLTTKIKERQDDVRALGARLALVANIVDKSSVEPWLDQRVAKAISSIEAQAEIHQRRIDTTQSTLQSLEKTQNSLTILRQRLLSTAQDILQRVSNPDHCPLCRTEFESGQLLSRMMIDVDGSTHEQIGLLQTEIASANEALNSAHAALETLRPIGAFLAERAEVVAVSEAIQQIAQERDRLDREKASLVVAQNQIQLLRIEGLSSESLARLLLAAGLTELPTFDAIQSLQIEQKEMLEKLQNSAKAALQESRDVREECEALAARLSIDIEDSAEALLKSVRKHVSGLEAALGARRTLVSFLSINADKTIDEIAIGLSSAQQQLTKVTTAMAQENANNAALDKETKAVVEHSNKIDDCDTKMKRSTSVEHLLETLIHQSADGELTNRILAENAQEIARTFASIHMPNEFELRTGSGKLTIVRRSTGTEIQLDQMSTGQRAAFALSLFLAMNGRLRSGPPVLLFDDPVAHIDDINVLSFLDHLRQLAISGTRQIFYATADTKLAGLFRHKFRFLGNDFKELVLSRT